MSDQAEYVVDRTGWARGPWDGEPDRFEWRSPETPEYALLIVRGPMGSLCGYVGLPPGHPLHGKVTAEPEVEALSCHGGVTYGSACAGHICHVPAPGEPDNVWWLGFDCAHARDYSPGLEARLAGGRGGTPKYEPGEPWLSDTYRDLDYVKTNVEILALQLLGSTGV